MRGWSGSSRVNNSLQTAEQAEVVETQRYAILRDILPNILIHQNSFIPLFKFVFRHIS